MKLLVITPIVSNTFSKMTENALQKSQVYQADLTFVTISKGPTCIEGFADEVLAGPYVLETIKNEESHYDGFFINCFGDVAVDAAREITRKPVLGAGESAFIMAALLGVPFTIVTIGSNANNKMHYRFKEMGFSRFVSGVGIEEGVLELNDSLEKTSNHICDAFLKEKKENHCEVLVLGCTGMIDVADIVREKLNCPVIEPTSTGIKLLEDLVELKLSHTHGGKYNLIT